AHFTEGTGGKAGTCPRGTKPVGGPKPSRPDFEPTGACSGRFGRCGHSRSLWLLTPASRSHEPSCHPSGHGPARLTGPRVADEGQAQSFTLELARIARAGEVNLEMNEVAADVGFGASLASAAWIGHSPCHRHVEPFGGFHEQVGAM